MKINSYLCDVCGTCVSVCPVDAIIVEENKVVLDEKKCVRCGKCIIVCPVKAISEKD